MRSPDEAASLGPAPGAASSGPPSGEDWSWRSRAYAWFVVAVVTIGLALAVADRMIVALMIGPIKHDLHLSDEQVGLVQGLAFTLLYVLAGLPMGRVADRGSRRLLAGASVVAWSPATCACAFVSGFGSLFGARLAVGIGEAGLSPAGYALIIDYFPKAQRSTPLTCLTLGVSAGMGLSFIGGGALIRWFGAASTIYLPLVGGLHGWQAVFVALGIAGLIFSLLFLLVKEPPRQGRTSQVDVSLQAPLRLLWRRRGYFSAQFVGIGLAAMVSLGFSSWMPAMLTRRFGWAPSTTGLLYGSCLAAAGAAGALLSGWVVRRLIARGFKNPAPTLIIGAVLIALPFMAIGPLLHSPTQVLACLAVGGVFMIWPTALAPVALQEVTPDAFRGQVFAVYILVMSFIGYAGGPFAVAFVSDGVLHNEAKLHLSLAIVAALVLPLAALLMGLALRFKQIIDRQTVDGSVQQ